MRRTSLMLLVGSIVAAACSDATGLEQRTLLVEFDHMPTIADGQALARQGAQVRALLEAVQGLLVRSSAEPAAFEKVSGVTSVKDLGPDEDPVLSVFIHVMSAPTEADLQVVRDAGGMGLSVVPARSLILAQMRVTSIDGLVGYDRFKEINVYPNTVVAA